MSKGKGWYGNSMQHSMASRGISLTDKQIQRRFSDKEIEKILEDNPYEYEMLRFTMYMKKLRNEMSNEVNATHKVITIGFPFEVLEKDELFGEILNKAEQDSGLYDGHYYRLDKYADKLYTEYRENIMR